LLAEGWLGGGNWVDTRLGGDFASSTIGWGLFHDLPNHVLGLHPRDGGVCAWHFFDQCATADRAAVLEDAFDGSWAGESPTLRAAWDGRRSANPVRQRVARTVPLLAINGTVTGGAARALISAADLAAWPRVETQAGPGVSPDPQPVAGTVDVVDSLCNHDLRLSTAALLGGRFPYVTPSGRLAKRCVSREIRLVDGGYTDNSGLFTIAALWPSLKRLVTDFNEGAARPIAPVIVELDNHHRAGNQSVARGSGASAETLIPLVTALGGRAAIETYARAVAYRLTPAGCTLTISPGLHPGLTAPLGWELAKGSRDELREGLVRPRAAAEGRDRLRPVLELRRLQAWLGGEQVPGLGPDLATCEPR
jgi:hypothetical protein